MTEIKDGLEGCDTGSGDGCERKLPVLRLSEFLKMWSLIASTMFVSPVLRFCKSCTFSHPVSLV